MIEIPNATLVLFARNGSNDVSYQMIKIVFYSLGQNTAIYIHAYRYSQYTLYSPLKMMVFLMISVKIIIWNSNYFLMIILTPLWPTYLERHRWPGCGKLPGILKYDQLLCCNDMDILFNCYFIGSSQCCTVCFNRNA